MKYSAALPLCFTHALISQLQVWSAATHKLLLTLAYLGVTCHGDQQHRTFLWHRNSLPHWSTTLHFWWHKYIWATNNIALDRIPPILENPLVSYPWFIQTMTYLHSSTKHEYLLLFWTFAVYAHFCDFLVAAEHHVKLHTHALLWQECGSNWCF